MRVAIKKKANCVEMEIGGKIKMIENCLVKKKYII
jgi:hypothetical protein